MTDEEKELLWNDRIVAWSLTLSIRPPHLMEAMDAFHDHVAGLDEVALQRERKRHDDDLQRWATEWGEDYGKAHPEKAWGIGI